jgi:hypothetical protein
MRPHLPVLALLAGLSAPAPAPALTLLPARDLRLEGAAPPSATAPAPALQLAPPGEVAARPRNYWLPAVEMLGWNLFQNRWSYYVGNREVYDVGWSVWKYNFSHWWWDGDGFSTNEFAHPYMGGLYYGMARSLGHDFWASSAYAFGGSLVWELFGETERPAFNDQISTTWGGIIIGEVLHRLSTRVLNAGGEQPGFWHELLAAALSPAQGFNRILHGNRYRDREVGQAGMYPELRVAVGVRSNADEDGVKRNPGLPLSATLHLVSGLPGTDSPLVRPFDHFDVTAGVVFNRSVLQNQSFLTLLLRGAVLARPYGAGTSRGLWGLYFNYDYVSPAVYRVSSSNVGLGTTGQLDLGSWALQGHALLGVGFGAGGSSFEVTGARDYHFGAQLAGQLELHAFYADRVRVRAYFREYFTGTRLSDQKEAWEDIAYLTLGASVRVAGRHALGLEILASGRNARYGATPDVRAAIASLSVAYLLLGDEGMGRGR